MFTSPCRNFRRRARFRVVVSLITSGLGFSLCGRGAEAKPAIATPSAETNGVLTGFEQLWQLSESEQRRSHRVRLDFEVFYHDPLWKSLWGQCGEAGSYLSLGATSFPIKMGQRIRVEGRIQPSRGLLVEDPTITLLAESVPRHVLATTGRIGEVERFDKRLVVIEGYVDRQVLRDANHLELDVVVEGRRLLVQLLLLGNGTVPQLQGALIRAEGVYSAHRDSDGGLSKIEVWVQGREHLQEMGTLERDPRFLGPATAFEALRAQPAGEQVRLSGTVLDQEVGKSVTIANASRRQVTLQTTQTLELRPGEEIEAIGFPANEGDGIQLRESLYRRIKPVVTSIHQLYFLSEPEHLKLQRVRFELDVYFFDSAWQMLWGRMGDSDEFLSLGSKPFPIEAGQRVLIEGMMNPSKNRLVEDARVTVLENVRPLAAIPVASEIGETSRFDRKLVVVEGYVDRQVRTDATHLALDLVVEGRSVIGRVLLKEGEVVPNWEGALLRTTGVYSATSDPTGGLPTIEVWVAGQDRVEALGDLAGNKEFNLPLTAIEAIGVGAPDRLVRIEGTARTQRPGRCITIRDETGQINVHTAQGRKVALGERIEVIGYPIFDGTEWSLRKALYRTSRAAPRIPAGRLPKLRLTDQLRELQPEEAAQSYPVHLSGIVTWARPNADFFFIRDASGGVCVFRPAEGATSVPVGSKVEIVGVSAPGKFAPVVLAESVQNIGSVELPEPRHITLEQALTGIEESQWVIMSGYVRAVTREGPWSRLELTTSAGEFQALLTPNSRWEKLPGSVVRVTGVCTAQANRKRQLTGIQVWVPSSRFVEIEEAMPADPFDVATRSLASLRQFSSLEALNRRVRVVGVVVHQAAGRLINLQEGTEGLLVLSRGTAPLIPGDRIEAVGFPGREHNRVVLREAVYRKLSPGDEPEAARIRNLSSIDAERDGLLVRVEGTLIDIGPQEKGTRLILQNQGVLFEATIDQSKAEVPATWVPGSILDLTGVYAIEFDEYRRPNGVRLQLRSVSDIRILQSPSGLTVKRVLAVTGVLAVGVVLGLGWVMALRRRVIQQTGVIRVQLEKEKAARLDAALARASKLESVGVLAGGIAHDFNNLLTVVIGNLSLAKLDQRIESETVRCLTESEKAAIRAKDLTQQLLTFAKGGEPVRTSTLLPDIVCEAAQFGLHGSNVRSQFEFAIDLWPAEVDKGQIAQVVHNLVINASQAMPAGGLVRISLSNEQVAADTRRELAPGRYVQLRIVDTGNGISEEHVARIFEPYFTTKTRGSGLGLATVYSIVKKHEGAIEVRSKLGEGTTFNVWLPAALGEPLTPVAAYASGLTSVGRVLIMDDELSIRQVASAVVKRMGLDVMAVNDGAAVVAEYEAARNAGRPYDVVILDLTVPGGMGGKEAMEKLLVIDPNVRAIVSSGYSSDLVMANHRSYQFCGRVPKPYTATDLMDVIKLVMGAPAG